MTNLIIFGAGQIAEIAYYMFANDSSYTPVAFTVDREYVNQPELFGLPIVPLDEVVEKFPPASHHAFAAVSYTGINKIRAAKAEVLKEQGYTLASYVSSRATTFPDVEIGENCLVLEDNTIQPYVTIGNNTFLWSGNHIGHHTTLEDHCYIASHVVISGSVRVGAYSFIGVNATVRDNVKIGRANVIGAACVILNDTEDENVFAAEGSKASRVPSSRLRRI